MKYAICFLLGILVVATAWKLTSHEALLEFTVPPNSTSFLAYRDETTQRMQMLRILASPGDTVELYISPGEQAAGIDEYFSLAMAPTQTEMPSSEQLEIRSKLGKIKILQHQHTPWKPSRFQFIWQDPRHHLLQNLRKREKIDTVLAGARSEIEKFARMQNWVRAQWQPSTPNPYPRWNAIEILDAIRAKKTGGFCGQYAQVFAQSLASLGYQTRYIGLHEHFAVEVWSNQFSRWIFFDPFFAVLFMRDEQYLSAYEIYQSVKRGTSDTIQVFSTHDGKFVDQATRDKILATHQQFEIYTRNDHIEYNVPADVILDNNWKDAIVLYDEYFSQRRFESGKMPMITYFSDDLYFTLNRVEVKLMEFSADVLTLRFRSDCPYPRKAPFRVTVDAGESTTSEEYHRWQLKPGKNTLRVAAVNASGISGGESLVEVEYIPND